MFDHLVSFERIVVTGPQRSGTTICAQMIAADTGRRYVPEEAFGATDKTRWLALLESERGIVVQCPAMCRYIHELSSEIAVVLMRREPAAILESQQRIHWPHEADELARYGRATGNQAVVKYAYFDEAQRPHIKHLFEVHYETLADHPLWLPVEQRVNFGPRQTTL